MASKIDVGFNKHHAGVEAYRAMARRPLNVPRQVAAMFERAIEDVTAFAHANRSNGSPEWSQLSEDERQKWRDNVRGRFWHFAQALDRHFTDQGYVRANEPPSPNGVKRAKPPTQEERARIHRDVITASDKRDPRPPRKPRAF